MFDLTSNKNHKTRIEPGKVYEVHCFNFQDDLLDINPIFCIKLVNGEFLAESFETENSARQFIASKSGICVEKIINEKPKVLSEQLQHHIIF